MSSVLEKLNDFEKLQYEELYAILTEELKHLFNPPSEGSPLTGMSFQDRRDKAQEIGLRVAREYENKNGGIQNYYIKLSWDVNKGTIWLEGGHK